MKNQIKERILVLDPKDYPKDKLLELEKKYSLIKKSFTNQKKFEQFIINEFKNRKNINHIFLSLNYSLKQPLLKKIHKSLKTVLTPTTGINHIDSDFLKKKKIKLIFLKRHKSLLNKINSTAELALTLMLSLLKNLNLAQKNVKKNLWKREDFISQQVSDLKVGVIGLGRLGLKFSKYCNSLSMKVYGYDIKKIKHQKYINRVKNMKYIFVNCDIISIHVDFNKYNKNLISKKYLKLMKKNSFIINTSRGELIDENFLHYLVKKKKIAGAGLDVLIINEFFFINLRYFLEIRFLLYLLKST